MTLHIGKAQWALSLCQVSKSSFQQCPRKKESKRSDIIFVTAGYTPETRLLSPLQKHQSHTKHLVLDRVQTCNNHTEFELNRIRS